MKDEQIAEAQMLASAIMNIIGRDPASQDIMVVMIALGIALGSYAKASKQPTTVMPIATRIADAVVSGEVLD